MKKQLAKPTLTHGFFPFETSPLYHCWRNLLILSQTCSDSDNSIVTIFRGTLIRNNNGIHTRFYCRSRGAENFLLVFESMNFCRIVLPPPAKCVPQYRELSPASGPKSVANRDPGKTSDKRDLRTAGFLFLLFPASPADDLSSRRVSTRAVFLVPHLYPVKHGDYVVIPQLSTNPE